MYKNKTDRHCPMKLVSVGCLRKERGERGGRIRLQHPGNGNHENLLLFNGPTDWPVLDVEISIIRINAFTVP